MEDGIMVYFVNFPNFSVLSLLVSASENNNNKITICNEREKQTPWFVLPPCLRWISLEGHQDAFSAALTGMIADVHFNKLEDSFPSFFFLFLFSLKTHGIRVNFSLDHG